MRYEVVLARKVEETLIEGSGITKHNFKDRQNSSSLSPFLIYAPFKTEFISFFFFSKFIRYWYKWPIYGKDLRLK